LSLWSEKLLSKFAFKLKLYRYISASTDFGKIGVGSKAHPRGHAHNQRRHSTGTSDDAAAAAGAKKSGGGRHTRNSCDASGDGNEAGSVSYGTSTTLSTIRVGLYRSKAQLTHSLKAPGFNP
jgi:hypothetical protein